MTTKAWLLTAQTQQRRKDQRQGAGSRKRRESQGEELNSVGALLKVLTESIRARAYWRETHHRFCIIIWSTSPLESKNRYNHIDVEEELGFFLQDQMNRLHTWSFMQPPAPPLQACLAYARHYDSP